ncbi:MULTISPECIES: hypothetical protein [Streptomyces]|uniref:hypothetical protein n=1 Tax=Streptomyces TaxID=1883 RepID=UPI002E16C112|nr:MULTISPECIES: hypothetical protein [unclassified Streptomyces]
MDTLRHRRAPSVLGAAQYLMVPDTSVMNVSVSRPVPVEDFDTEVTAYALGMA